MAESYDLSRLDPNAFEHMVNMLVMRTLGLGHTGFGPGSDGGRDGYFEGEAAYPSEVDCWSGRWYIQCKFHKPHLSTDPQKWLLDRIKEEIAEFKKPDSKRRWPDNWIVVTNIDPSGVPETGSFDQALSIVGRARAKLKSRFHIWGGNKVISLLTQHSDVSEYYRHFLTPGHILTAVYNQLKDAHAEIESVLRFLIVKQFGEQQYTKLEQAGSDVDTRPGIHRLFIDLPFRCIEHDLEGMTLEYLTRSSAKCHRVDSQQPDTSNWRSWNQHPTRARVWFIKGGPGQGKSTIGQYFCQIQRAAFILQEDGPRVLPQQKTLALEVQDATTKMGFWPDVPRIPVIVELKEYSQWFGQQSSDSPRGVLTYLAERITIGIEQKALIGTLRRALRNHKWFFAFDGLDEVPQDVKDSIAREIRHFVDNVVVENDTDMLILCTSRPQGYSGQFSDLDCSTIDMINLSSEQALKCAKPVLHLGRTDEEAEKAFDILSSATESGSVQELMTSPLQAHIMAVVVRDGGRPPERRWQLFNNFYDVIKKREANRNLPDRAIAKLLREDEQLLKTVHNRLGFILHARAESSEGAQTHLNRDEFRSLVKSAVSQMMEGDINRTVAVLMEATTDRLVLVSTPDDGNHVRFDIRPLQEFFAAEFIYEAVSADELRQRLELIVGDAHWREVVHFLMSALVENGRRTELAVAVEVIEQLNEGNENVHIRLLHRRLGRGALLAARLLQEGVLEQDKRVRYQFRRAIEPLMAFTETGKLNILLGVTQSSSLPWLLNFLIDTLIESNPTESIGAAIVLKYLLPEGHERMLEVRKFFLGAPSEYLSFLLNARSPSSYNDTPHRSTKVSIWFLDLTLTLLTRPEWHQLNTRGISGAISILRQHRREVMLIARKSSLTTDQLGLLRGFLDKETHERSGEVVEDYGIIEADCYEHDWTNQSFENSFWDSEIGKPNSNAPGILQLVYRVLRFGKNRNHKDILSLFDLTEQEGPHILDALPGSIKAYLPLNQEHNLSDQINEIRSLNENEFRILMRDRKGLSYPLNRPLSSFTYSSSNCNIVQWTTLVEDHPRLALQIWGGDIWRRLSASSKRPDILARGEAIEILMEGLIKSPYVLLVSPEAWGKLLKTSFSRRHELRRAILEASLRPVNVERFSLVDEFHSFKLILPDEANLLPHLANALIAYQKPVLHRNRVNWESKRISVIVRDMIENIDILQQIILDEKMQKNNRAAALILELLHPLGNKVLQDRKDLIIELYDPNNGGWYLRAISLVLAQMTSEADLFSQLIIGGLLEVVRDDFGGQQYFQLLLELWRENSYAPIHKSGVEEKWLRGE